MVKNLVLGTANFGAKYGIANGETILQENETTKIVKMAEKSGIFQFDTAPSYKNAENQLGTSLKDPKNARVFTKISAESTKSVVSMITSVEKSQNRTKVTKFSGIYLHDENIYSSIHYKEISNGIRELINSGITDRVGISVYSLEALMKAKEKFPEMNLFQIPENICDRRLYNSQELRTLSLQDNHIYVRSIFLQGLLLMDPQSVPNGLLRVTPNLEALIKFSNLHHVTRHDLCLSYAKSISWATGIIVGVASVLQMSKILNHTVLLPEDFGIHLPPIDIKLLDPRVWPEL